MITITFDSLIEADCNNDQLGQPITIEVEHVDQQQLQWIAQRAAMFGQRFKQCSHNC